MTWWSENDLAGRLLAEPEGERWQVLNFPALAEEDDLVGRQSGEPRWPTHFGVKGLQASRKALGSYPFAAV